MRLCYSRTRKIQEDIKHETWNKAMQEEIHVVKKNKTWHLVIVKKPQDKEVIGMKGIHD